DRADEAVVAELDHRLPAVDVLVQPGERPVDEVDVDVVEAEVGQRLVETLDRFVVAVVTPRELGADEDLRTRQVVLAHGLPDALLVLVAVRRVEGGGRRGAGVVASPGERAEADGGYRVAVVQRQGRDVHRREATGKMSGAPV